jgi:DnaJ family protein A protein 5
MLPLLYQQGFYGVYSTLFSTLGEQEVSAAEEAGNQTPPQPPAFGSSTSEAAEVYAFYNWWGAFATSKEFAWADQYNPAAAPNRQVGRLCVRVCVCGGGGCGGVSSGGPFATSKEFA